MTMMIGVVGVVAVTGLLLMLTVRPAWVESVALGLTVGLQVLVPAFGPSQLIRAGVVAVSVCYLILALLRRGRPVGRVNFPILAMIFVGYLTFGNFIGARLPVVGYWALIGLMLILSAVLVADGPARARSAVRVVLLISIPVELLVSVAEQMRLIQTAWPRGDASDEITNRAHQFLGLIGRSEGTTGHPILLGTLSAIGVVVALWSMLRARRVLVRIGYLVLAAMAVGTALLSGTRSALLTLGGCVLLWFLTARVIPWVIRICVLGGVVALGYRQLLDVAYSLLASVRDTTSFEHRFGVLGNVPRLLGRHGSEFWFGYGGGVDVGELFRSGAIAGHDQLAYFDDQWVRLLAVSGVIGVLLCLAMLLVGIWRTDQLGRLLIVMLVVMFFSFDLFTWTLPSLLLILAVAGPLGAQSDAAAPADAESEPVTRRKRAVGIRRAWEYEL